MTTFQIRYWFDSSASNRHGEMIAELFDAGSEEVAADYVRENLSLPAFVVKPSGGPTFVRVVVLQSAQVRFVEIARLEDVGAPAH